MDMIFNLLKAAVGTVLLPVAVVVDAVTLPASATDLRKGPFDRTGNLANTIGKNIKEALES